MSRCSARRASRVAVGLVAILATVATVVGSDDARAEVEISVFGGEHSFAAHNALGRAGATSYQSTLVDSPQLGARFTVLPHPRFGVDLEVATAPTADHSGAGVNVPSIRLNGVLNLLTGRIRPFFLLGAAGLISSPADSVHESTDARFAAVAGTGVRVDVGSWWGLRVDGRLFALPATTGYSVAFDREWSIGIYGRFPAPPPPEVRGRENELIADADSDGLGDRTDKCPSVAGPIRNYGCPIDEDRDHDGIVDKDDSCPDLAGSAALHGCLDTDGDGIVDSEDRCPKEAGPKENQGCPDGDRDHDGIVDRLDKCPDAPETVNGFQDEDGCPDQVPQAAAPPPIKNVDAIDFDKGRNTLTKASYAILDAAAEVLKDHPESNVQIVGHTDATGNEALNLRLSRERAEAVRVYLVAHGINANRVTAIGKGSAEPLTSGTSEADRARNRRVEFRFSAAKPR